MKKIVYYFAILFVSLPVLSQRNFSLYQLNTTAQSHYFNPAFKPSANVYVSLPLGMQSFGFSHGGFTFNDLLSSRSQDDSLEFTPSVAIDKMGKLNYVSMDLHNELFGFGLRVKKNYFSFGLVHRSQINFMYTQDMFRFVFEGNGKSFIGERASLDGLGFNMHTYLEYGFGYNRQISDKLTVGGRLKLLSGVANIQTKKTELGITTDAEDFDITIDGAAQINTSNINPFVDSTQSSDFNPIPYAFNFQNSGLAVDLGATYKLNDKISFSGSIMDLGSIKWKTNNRNFVTDDFNFTFRGVDLNEFLKDSSDVFQELGDSIQDAFNQTENTDQYRTSLYTRVYLGGSYQLTKQFSASALWYNEFILGKYKTGLTLAANAKLGEWLTATVNYSVYNRSFANLGAGFSLRGGPIQFYCMTDNLLGVMRPQGSKNWHVTFGMGLLFGKPDKEKDKTANRINE